jgi:hypothetical protein
MSLLDKVKETAQKGVEKTKGAVSDVQEKVEERKVEKKISDLKEELGGLVYGQKIGTPAENADAEIERIVGEIKAAEAELVEPEKDADTETEAATETEVATEE